ncbi:hypothetical protein ScPMuIL_012131 [Solemya velum]
MICFLPVAFLLENGMDHTVTVEAGGSVEIPVVYAGIPFAPVLSAIIQDNGTVIEGTVSTVAQTGSVTLHSSNFPTYGQFVVLLQLKAGAMELSITIVAQHDQPISNLQLTAENLFIFVHDVMTYSATASLGTNVNLEWLMDDRIECFQHQDAEFTGATYAFNFTEFGDYSLTLLASNSLSFETRNVTVRSQYRINGLSMSILSDFIETTESAVFTLQLDTNASLPMGNLEMITSYDTQTTPLPSVDALYAGVQFTHIFTTQGETIVNFNITSENDLKVFTFEIHVWDKLDVKLFSSKTIANVLEPITFTFFDPPLSGFEYHISYGDGSDFISDSSILYSPYTNVTQIHEFVGAGMYVVTMTASNPAYTSGNSFLITVQHPIPADVTFVGVDGYHLPFPDGIFHHHLTMVDQYSTPTNVTCLIDYGDSHSIEISVDLTCCEPIDASHEYTSPGTYNMSLECWNLVSDIEWDYTIEVSLVDVNNFELAHKEIVGLNSFDSVTVEFNVVLFDITRVPPGISYINFDFGDHGYHVTEHVNGFSFKYEFTTRMYLEGYCKIEYNNRSKTIPIGMFLGVLDFAVDKTRGTIANSVFTFSVQSREGYQLRYAFNSGVPGSADATLPGGGTSTTFTYAVPGVYIPYVTGWNSTFSESAFVNESIYVDNPIESLDIVVDNYTVNFPPGRLELSIYLPTGHLPLSNLGCTVNYGDVNDPKLYELASNLTIASPMSHLYNYSTLGDKIINVTCKNYIDLYTTTIAISIFSDCFSSGGMFDRQYSSKDTPMKTYTSMSVELSSRMDILCPQFRPIFQWQICEVTPKSCTSVQNPPHSEKGSIAVAKAALGVGLYQFTLTVTHLDQPDIWASESTYIHFIKKKPYAYIAGGTKRSVKAGVVTVDAISESFDVDGGYGDNGKLVVEWSCTRFNTSEIRELENIYVGVNASDYGSVSEDPLCGEKETTPGVITINASSSVGFIITATVLLDGAASPYTQMVQVLDGNPPEVSIECKANCMEKVAVTQTFQLVVKCKDCTDTEWSQAQFSWLLKSRQQDQRLFTDVNDWEHMTDTGTHLQSIVIKENQLTNGIIYELQVVVEVINRRVVATAVEFLTNSPPYDGHCHISPAIGNASVTLFDMFCVGWHDEGERTARDKPKDGNEVLSYVFVLRQNGEDRILAFGSESSASGLKLPLGNPERDYNISILARIQDTYGDHAEFALSAKVIQPIVIPNTSGGDSSQMEAAVGAFLTSVDADLEQSLASADPKNVARLIESTASVLASIPTGNSTGSTSDGTTSDGGGSLVSALTPVESKIQKVMKETTSKFVDILGRQILSLSDEGAGEMSSNAAQQYLGSLNTVLFNPSYVTEESAVSAGISVDIIAEKLLKIMNQRPIPVGENIDESASGGIDIIGKVTSALATPSMVDIPDDINEETIKQQIEESDNSQDSSLTIEERVLLSMKIAQRQKLSNDKKRKASKESFGNIHKAVSSIGTALAKNCQIGQPVMLIAKRAVKLTVEKQSRGQLLNQSVERAGVKLTFSETKVTNNSSSMPIDLKVIVFDSNPYTWANNSNSINSEAITIDLLAEDYGERTLPDTVTISIKSKYKPPHLKPEPSGLIEGDRTGMIYHRIILADSQDDLIVVIYEPIVLYHAYFRKNGKHPTTSLYDYIAAPIIENRTPLTLKYIVPSGELQPGRHVIGMLAGSYIEGNRRQRRRRSVLNETVSGELLKSNFTMAVASTGCRVWNDGADQWDATSCRVSPDSNLYETICVCKDSPGTTRDSVSLYHYCNLDTTCDDKKDLSKWSINFLIDNEVSDSYFYLLTIHTGLRRGAGTKSKVYFVIAGDNDDTGVRVLTDGIHEGFPTGSIVQFVVGVPAWLGDVTYIHIWHDNSGGGNAASWYLHKMELADIQRSEGFTFYCDNWLSLDQGDAEIERIVPVCPHVDVDNWESRFQQNTRYNITDNHLWLSIFLRPERSSFTRLQRLSCLVALLLLTMIANAMFFRSEPDIVKPDQVAIGSIRFSLQNLYISFIGIVISTPPVLLVATLFRNVRLRDKKQKAIDKKLGYLQENHLAHATKGTATPSHGYGLEQDISNSRLPLPHACLYLAWFVTIAAVVTPAFFLILYSMEWGKTKSEEWLTTFLLSFVESLLVVDPIKVIVISALVASVFKATEGEFKQEVDIDGIRTKAAHFTGATTRPDRPKLQTPLPQAKLQIERTNRKYELRAQRTLLELVLYCTFLFAVYSISYSNRDTRSFHLKQNIDKHLVQVPIKGIGFSDIKTHKDIIRWLNFTFFDEFFPLTEVNGERLSIENRRLFSDLSNLRVGPARLRQMRVTQDVCRSLSQKSRPCFEEYSFSNEDTVDYCIGWHKEPCAQDEEPFHFTSPAWRYTSSLDIWGLPVSGIYNTYGGGGYILNFDINPETSVMMLNELVRNKWLDRKTRAVFVEFTLYNPNSNLFIYVIYLAEFLETGGVFPWTHSQAIRVHQDAGALGSFTIVCQVIFVLMLLVFSFGTLRTLCREKRAYFKDLWQTFDLCGIIVCFVLIGFFAVQRILAEQTLSKFREDKKKFLNFYHIIIWDMIYNALLAFVTFFATIRILKILSYNRRITEVATVVSYAGKDLIGIFTVFSLVFLAYVLLGFLLFGNYLEEYKSVFTAMGTLTNSIIGKNKLDSMIQSVPLFAQVYFFTFAIFIIFALVTMFVASLNNSIYEIRRDMKKEEPTYGVLDLIGSVVRKLFGNDRKKGATNCEPELHEKTSDNAFGILALVRDSFQEWDLSQQNKQTCVGHVANIDLLEPIFSTPSTKDEKRLRLKGAGDRNHEEVGGRTDPVKRYRHHDGSVSTRSIREVSLNMWSPLD